MSTDRRRLLNRAPVTRLLAALLIVVISHETSFAQGTTGTFVPGSREIYALNLTSVPDGGLPKGMTLLRGKVSVIKKAEGPMLKASEPAEVLISLPELLPDGFTLEFEIIPKACCNPEDIAFEGTATISRSTTSMHVQWHPETIIMAGGGEYAQISMPQDLKEILPSAPTTIAASFQGTAFKLFTNGRQVVDLPNKRFARGRVLRVFLGGQDDDQHAVYLSKLRIAATSGTVASTSSADLSTAVASGATGTITEVTGTRPIGTVASPTTTSVTTPTSAGVTAGPLPTGSITSPSAAIATQPAALSSPTNPLPVVSTGTTAQTQNAATAQPDPTAKPAPTTATPLPSSKTVTGSTSPTVAGPATLTASPLGFGGWGIDLKWPALSGVTTYWVSRKATSTTDPAQYTNALIVPSGDASVVRAIDPFVQPSTAYTYWVVGFVQGSGETKPSPIANVVSGAAPSAPVGLTVSSVSAPSMLTMPGPLGATSPMLGSTVTWGWTKTSNVFLYQISYEIVGGVAGVGPVFARMAVPANGSSPVPPMTVNVPQGKTVILCVHLYASADQTAPLPSGKACVQPTVP